MRQITTYNKNKSGKVGDKCVCPSCGTEFIKEYPQQAFCRTKGGTICKDKFWNSVTTEKRNNTTRISPANRTYYENVICRQNDSDYYDDYDPEDSEYWDNSDNCFKY